MHWVDRGEEPTALEPIRLQRTPGWVAHYSQFNIPRIGKPPRDNGWNEFLDTLGDRFYWLCGYCEDWGKLQVDHFRPKSKFPDLVYVWSNWVLSCIGCNFTKRDKWPSGGYVDPCENVDSAHPESFFRFDMMSKEILPRDDQSEQRKSIAWDTIVDLGLNDFHHLRKRADRLSNLEEKLQGKDEAETRRISADETSRDARLSSVARAWLLDRGYLDSP